MRPIDYNGMYREQFDELVNRASTCRQYIKYECQASRLLADAGETRKSTVYVCLNMQVVFSTVCI